MKVIKNPWKKTFLDLVSESNNSIKITSPFVKFAICDELLKLKKEKVSLDLITSFKLPNIYGGSLDLKALSAIISQNGTITNFSSLHAKIYIFDDRKAVITS
jgi:phosphatidylserine/phosphatidylglycerophosphate/cardiolipin synthase-like enzyme